jgi:predicted DCC family thiol-disulfide oxidoreductase YuxK
VKLPEAYIVFYDGLCPLCNAVVRKLLAYDKKEQLYFASLQSPLAKEFLKERRIENEDTVILWYPGTAYWTRSAAVFQLAQLIGGAFVLLRPFRFLPKFITDSCYNWVAKWRFKWTTPYDTCPTPPKAYIKRFL